MSIHIEEKKFISFLTFFLNIETMSEIEPLYCAEQIKVPPSMPEILKAWTKAVIRENVSQVSNFFYNRRKRIKECFFFTS